MRIPFTKFYQDAKNPTHHHAGDAGLDFYSLEYYAIPAHHYEVVKTGIRVEVPEGYVGLLFPKGSYSHVLGGAGVIDTYYEGEVMFKVVNYFDFSLIISKHDAIGQMIFVPFTEPEPYEANFLVSRSNGRGDSGGIKCGGPLDKSTLTIV